MFNVGWIVLISFVLLRPIIMICPSYNGINILNYFGILFSYLMLLVLVFNIRRIHFKKFYIILLFFCFYCVLSLLWGSSIREVSRKIFPYIAFFIGTIYVRSISDFKRVIGAMIIGYIIPIVGSTIMILAGKSEIRIMRRTGIVRYAGLFSGQHSMAHIMLFYSYVFAIYKILSGQTKRYIKLVAHYALFVMSIFCIYKTFTRTVFLGLLVFWLIALWGWSKKLFFIFLMLLIIATGYLTVKGTFDKYFWQVKDASHSQRSIDDASSGRLTLWKHNIELFKNLPLTKKLLGVGLGNENKNVIGSRGSVWSSHSDYLSILMTLGIIGLAIYFLQFIGLIIFLVKEVRVPALKYIYYGIIIAVIAMDLVSNSYFTRFELSQLFWLFWGMIYGLHENEKIVVKQPI